MTADPVPLGTPSAATTIPVPDITDGRPCAKRITTSCNALRFKKFQSTRLLGRQNAKRNALEATDDCTDDLYLPLFLPLNGRMVRMFPSLMGDRRKQALRVQFDGKLELEFQGAKITSDAGLLAFPELDEAFRLTEKGYTVLPDARLGKNTQHTMLALLRQGVYGRLAGYEDVNDAERLRFDPAMCHVVGGRAKEKEAASTSEMSRFETEMLSSRENLTELMNLPGTWIDSVHECAPLDKLILDLDSSVNSMHGDQEVSTYNGYFECTCYHPLFLFNQHGDLERAMLRRGSHNSAKFWRRVLLPVIERYRDRDIPKYFHGDAAFAIPALYRVLEEESFQYTICIAASEVLMFSISHLLTRPVGRPSYKPRVFYESFSYQAQSWDHPRRVVAKVEWHFDELFPCIGFIVSNMTGWSRKGMHFYNQRGTAEQWIKEGKYAIKWTRLPCHDFKDNQVRLQLFALAYNLGNFLRRLAPPRSVKHWSLTTLREKLIKIGAKVVHHSKYVTFQMAEVAVPRELFARSSIASSGSVCHRRCCNTLACRDRVKNMTIPARGWLVLRRMAGKRLPRRSDKEKWTGSGVEKKASSGKRRPAIRVGLSIR